MQTPQGAFIASLLSPATGPLFFTACATVLTILVAELQREFFKPNQFWPQALLLLSLWALVYDGPLIVFPAITYILQAAFLITLVVLPFTAQNAAKKQEHPIRSIGLLFVSSLLIFSPTALPFANIFQGAAQWIAVWIHGFSGRDTLFRSWDTAKPSNFSIRLNVLQALISIPVFIALITSTLNPFAAQIIFLITQWIPIESLIDWGRFKLLTRSLNQDHPTIAPYIIPTYAPEEIPKLKKIFETQKCKKNLETILSKQCSQ